MGVAVPPDRRCLGDPAGMVRGGRTVLITAGASAPEDVVQECIEYLETHHRRDASRRLRSGKRMSTSPCPSRFASCSPPGLPAARPRPRRRLREGLRRAPSGLHGRSGLDRLPCDPAVPRMRSVPRSEIRTGRAEQLVVLVLLLHLAEDPARLAERGDDQGRHLDQGDRPDELGAEEEEPALHAEDAPLQRPARVPVGLTRRTGASR